MKKLFKWMFRLVLVLVLLVALLIVFLDPIAKSLVQRQIRRQTGLEVAIGKLTIGLSKPSLTILNFKLFNSPDFGGSLFLDIPEFHLQYEWEALRAKKLHLILVRLNLRELHIIQDKDGNTNLRALQERSKSGLFPSGAPELEFLGIDTLVLTLGKIKFTSEKFPASSEESYIGIKNEKIKNVKSEQELRPLAARIALEKGLRFLSEKNYSPVSNLLRNSTNSAVPIAPKTNDTVIEVAPKQ